MAPDETWTVIDKGVRRPFNATEHTEAEARCRRARAAAIEERNTLRVRLLQVQAQIAALDHCIEQHAMRA